MGQTTGTHARPADTCPGMWLRTSPTGVQHTHKQARHATQYKTHLQALLVLLFARVVESSNLKVATKDDVASGEGHDVGDLRDQEARVGGLIGCTAVRRSAGRWGGMEWGMVMGGSWGKRAGPPGDGTASKGPPTQHWQSKRKEVRRCLHMRGCRVERSRDGVHESCVHWRTLAVLPRKVCERLGIPLAAREALIR